MPNQLPIDVQVDARRIARVTIHNEKKLNTLNSALMDAFIATVDGLSSDGSLRAVVLTGAGEKAFIGGADIQEMSQLTAHTAESFIRRLHRCCDALRTLPVPVIARIQGYALGGGLEIAAACDIRVAADTAIFGMPEVKLGIPSVIEAALLPMLVGWGRTREILLLGDTFSAAQALSWGLVETVVPASDLDAAVERRVASLLEAGNGALRLQKKLIRQWEDLPLRDAIEAGVQSFVEAWQTDEPARRMKEFLAAKKKPG